MNVFAVDLLKRASDGVEALVQGNTEMHLDDALQIVGIEDVLGHTATLPCNRRTPYTPLAEDE